MAVPEGFVLIPIVPTKKILQILLIEIWPEDWENGKWLQSQLGLEVIGPCTEAELMAGQYLRLINHLKENQP